MSLREQMHRELLNAWETAEPDWNFQGNWNNKRRDYHTCMRKWSFEGKPSIKVWLIPRDVCKKAGMEDCLHN